LLQHDYLLLHDDLNLASSDSQLSDLLTVPSSNDFRRLFPHSISVLLHKMAAFESVCFELIALVDFVWIPWVSSAIATELFSDINCLCLWSIACQPVSITQIV
jgi:hypothetical protein